MNANLKVKKIREGTVIDHIPSGKGFTVSNILALKDKRNVYVILSNVEGKRGKKDVVKIESKFLDETELNKISIVAPDATINLIKNFEVIKKYQVIFPEKLINLLKCPNPNCITNNANENVTTKFKPEKDKLRCFYCERTFQKNEVKFL